LYVTDGGQRVHFEQVQTPFNCCCFFLSIQNFTIFHSHNAVIVFDDLFQSVSVDFQCA
jgi:hypothetical protein